MSDFEPNELLFPHPEVRKIQTELLKDVENCLKEKKDLIVHAPTGLGKTAATIAPALAYALKKDLTVFFLTSRHTQHRIAIETLKKVKEKHKAEFNCIDVIGKKWMCVVPGIEGAFGYDFNEFCKKEREDNKCEFYSNLREKGKLTLKAKRAIEQLKKIGPCHTEEVIEFCKKEGLCPYEITMQLAKDSSVVIADYYYAFNPTIRKTFLQKAGKHLEDSILIIDEGHNLPKRCRDLFTHKLTSFMIDRASKEAGKFGYLEVMGKLKVIKDALEALSSDLNSRNPEKLINKDEFVEAVEGSEAYDEIIDEFNLAADEVREKQKQSSIGGVVGFLENWLNSDDGFARILSIDSNSIRLMYKCLDPSISTKEIISQAYSSILMSGTLTPTSMYKDILGFENADEKVLESPFPKENRLSLVIPETTTKFTKRSEGQFRNIANVLIKVISNIPGNAAVYFPSYDLRDSVYRHFYELYEDKDSIVLEKPMLSKSEKEGLIKDFKDLKDKGGVLLAVASGSFGEGIDLPGDYLKGVIVVGLPLEKPNLETKELINYYDKKFGKGWDYGYIFPALTKTMQNAGRCIRSDTDKGVIVFLDERYAWPNYFSYFPPDYHVKITKLYEKNVKNFFLN
jgi:DNA excision repair protein ERCC-2